MKVALVHDYLTRRGGAERVLAALSEIWSEAPVFTSVRDLARKHELKGVIRESWLQRFPAFLRGSKLLTPFYPLVFENLDLSGFEVIISSGYFSKAILTTPGQLHVNYCHTVPRFLYGYPTETRFHQSGWGRILAAPISQGLRIWDYYSAQRPDYLVANSQTVAARIKKFWGREATVIYPPVELPEVAEYRGPGSEYFLIVSRLESYKNIALAIKACTRLSLPLKIAGEGSDRRHLQQLAGPTVELLGRVSDAERNQLYSGCKALLFPVQDEDFGIVPVEAMGFGKPVIALRSGGVRETVVEGETGLFFDKPTVGSLVGALRAFDSSSYFTTAECFARCVERAARFSRERFAKEFKKFVETKFNSLRHDLCSKDVSSLSESG